ncbi:hypothetical protein ACJ73_05808 [Blastomyces percursus]|uniref:Uncharacterized protein n=1 Tax=Blastomyces percursus TaxID=1658174 RepID=A0A1J9R4B1_9EURO|nr:hypothetical protein ACJ73_05808 [Blastomyces percursus]
MSRSRRHDDKAKRGPGIGCGENTPTALRGLANMQDAKDDTEGDRLFSSQLRRADEMEFALGDIIEGLNRKETGSAEVAMPEPSSQLSRRQGATSSDRSSAMGIEHETKEEERGARGS